jgi:hypothetical protein
MAVIPHSGSAYLFVQSRHVFCLSRQIRPVIPWSAASLARPRRSQGGGGLRRCRRSNPTHDSAAPSALGVFFYANLGLRFAPA